MILIDKKKPMICIDPGHGGNDSGAVGPNGLKESDVVLSIAKELRYQLELKGIDSFLTREEDDFIQLSKRCQLSDEKNSLLFLSIHCNAVGTPTAQGIETVFDSRSGRGKALANYIQQAMMKYCKDHKNRGIKASPSADYPRKLYVLTQTKAPAALVECEFISHPEWEKWLGSFETQKLLANALCEAIISFLKSLPGAELIQNENNDDLKKFIDDIFNPEDTDLMCKKQNDD